MNATYLNTCMKLSEHATMKLNTVIQVERTFVAFYQMAAAAYFGEVVHCLIESNPLET